MRYGMTEKGERVDAMAWTREREEQLHCSVCGSELRFRDGSINISHFAHKSLADCDDFTHEMSEWHRNWQNQFPEECREVVITHEDPNFGEVKSHRADVCMNGYVIEFQHSPISYEEFYLRNDFYNEAGFKVIWIFDLIEEHEAERIYCTGEWDGKYENGLKRGWNHPRRFMRSFLPQRDKKRVVVLFQIQEAYFDDEDDEDETYLEKVTWAINDDGYSNFKRFFTSWYPANVKELKEKIQTKKI